MAKPTTVKKEKLVSALSLWRSYDVSGALNTKYLEMRYDKATGLSYMLLTYDGHAAEDGRVRIFAYYARPMGDKSCPAILLLKEAGKPADLELMNYFVKKGYAVLMPDYEGETALPSEGGDESDDAQSAAESFEPTEAASTAKTATFLECTEYPASLSYANYSVSQGMYDLEGIPSDQTCWYEWTYVALYSLEYLKSRTDVDKIGVVGVRTGGEIAWKVMISPDVSCGVPINAAGWLSVRGSAKFAELSAINMTDERHRYIAAVDSQSYAPFVKCPVLMLCALSDYSFDADRAYDTYVRIGGEAGNDESAIVYSAESGSCIGKNGLSNMDIFLEKHLKGREIFIPSALNISVKDEGGKLFVEVCGDEEAIVEEMGVCYAESDPTVRSFYRDWQCVYKQAGTSIKNGKIECEIVPFEGTPSAFVYAYAKYLNGFVMMTKILAKHFPVSTSQNVGSKMLFSGEDMDCFRVSQHEDYSIADVFLENEATPKLVSGYGGIQGAYSVGGIKTYKISSPRYVAKEGDLLKFDAYAKEDFRLTIGIEVAQENGLVESYFCHVPIKGGGKWKRIILEAKDFKNEIYGRPLSSFAMGSALSFTSKDAEEREYVVTNILWL